MYCGSPYIRVKVKITFYDSTTTYSCTLMLKGIISFLSDIEDLSKCTALARVIRMFWPHFIVINNAYPSWI